MDMQYVAGFFDGEGSVGLYKNGNGKYYLRSQLAQNVNCFSKQLFSELKAAFGGNVSVQTTTHGEKFNWQLSGDKLIKFLRELRPHLRFKHEQVDVGLLWKENQKPIQRDVSTGRILPGVDPFGEKAGDLIKRLKKRSLAQIAAEAGFG